MALDFNPEDYGLTKVEKGGSTDDGFIDDGQGNYYKINDFERQQKAGSDTDKLGKSAGLQSLAEEHTDFNVTTFNTVNDVQGALRHLAAEGASETDAQEILGQSWNEALESGNLSQPIQDAVSRTQNYQQAQQDNIDYWRERRKNNAATGAPVFESEGNMTNLFQGDRHSIVTDQAKAKQMAGISDKVLDTIIDKY